MAGFQTMSGIPKVTSTANFYSNTNPLLQSLGIGGFAEPAALFGNGEQGAWWDFSDLANMWQDSTGATPAVLESPVGFVLDKRLNQGMRGQELASSTNTVIGWAAAGSTLSADGISGLTITNTAAAEGFANLANGSNVAVANASYEIILVTAGTGGSVTVGGTRVGLTGATSQRFIITAGANGPIKFGTNNGALSGAVTFKSISVKSLGAGNHLIQPTAGARPTLSRRFNYNSSSEDLTTWTAHSVNISIQSKTSILNNGIASDPKFQIFKDLPAGGNQDYTVSVLASAGSCTQLSIQIKDRSTDTVKTSTAAQIFPNAKIFQLSGVTAGASAGLRVEIGTNGQPGDINILGVDIRLTADAALAMPQYQRVGATATDYDTLGFPAYLLFDGATKWMQSVGNIPFSGQQMTSFVGQSDFASSTVMLYEHGTSIAAVDGTFNLGTAPGLQYLPAYRGTVALEALNTGNLPVPYNAVLSTIIDGTQPTPLTRQLLYSNNAQLTLALNSGGTTAGPFTSQTFYVGSRAGTSQFFNGRMFGMIVRGAATNDNDFQMTNKWMGSKCGLFF